MLSRRLTVDGVRRKWETEAMNGMFWFQLVVIVALLAAVGWLAVGGGGHMSEPVQDRPDLALPPDGLLGRRDVDRVRFSVGARGYRMDEVDDVLDRLAHEIDLRERRIAELEGHPYEEEEYGADHAIAAPSQAGDDYAGDNHSGDNHSGDNHSGDNHSEGHESSLSEPELVGDAESDAAESAAAEDSNASGERGANRPGDSGAEA
jgi:DivIVA domain-containing protein